MNINILRSNKNINNEYAKEKERKSWTKKTVTGVCYRIN